jgi:hypothetical protein
VQNSTVIVWHLTQIQIWKARSISPASSFVVKNMWCCRGINNCTCREICYVFLGVDSWFMEVRVSSLLCTANRRQGFYGTLSLCNDNVWDTSTYKYISTNI